MLKKPTRTFAIVTLVLCVVAIMWSWLERPAQDGAAPPHPSRADAITQAPAIPLVPPSAVSSKVAGEEAPSTAPPASVAPVRLRVRAPSDVQLGQVFQAQIELEADRAVRELLFTVTFAKSRLALSGWEQGDFAQRGGLPGETGAEEPSDGNVQVSFIVGGGLSIAGAGTIITLQLEARRAGVSSITVGDVYAIGSNGAAEPGVAILESGAVTIH